MIRRPPRSTLFPLHDALPISQRAGVQSIDAAELARFESEATERTLYRFDVRTREEYQAGHLPGWRWAPGGQLVQATDEYAARSEEHTSELQSQSNLVCRLLLEKKK